MLIEDLGYLPYHQAWAVQERAHEAVVNGGEEQILFVEHPPVITLGRRPGGERNLLASAAELRARNVAVVNSDRGGDVTFHGPGQIVVYPIIRLTDHGHSVSGYVHRLEEVVIATLAKLGIAAQTDPAAIGVWTRDGDTLAKICAIGVRIRRGITLHGLALNHETDLSFFDLIVPCGLTDRPVTSIRRVLGDRTPRVEEVKKLLGKELVRLI